MLGRHLRNHKIKHSFDWLEILQIKECDQSQIVFHVLNATLS